MPRMQGRPPHWAGLMVIRLISALKPLSPCPMDVPTVVGGVGTGKAATRPTGQPPGNLEPEVLIIQVMRPRLATARLQRLAARFPAVAILGARQVGKSTLLAETVGRNARAFVFDPVMDVANARQDPELFLRLNPPPLILDEVQFVPELLGPLKRIVDERRSECGQYFLTGSQQFGLMRGLRESLAGRVGLLELLPMTQVELYGDLSARPTLTQLLLETSTPEDLFAALSAAPQPATPPPSLPERVFRGGMPGLLPFETAEVAEFFATYLSTYIERDVRTLRDFTAPYEFARFVRLLAALTAQELNASQLGREIGISPHTAREWLDVLIQSFQVQRIDAFSTNATKRVSGRPKLHLVDTGFAAWLASISSPLALQSHPMFGALFESYVVGELSRQATTLATPPQRWHWRSAGGAEVDLLLERDGVFHLIEVKLTSRPSRRDTSGLRAFAESYPGLRLGHRVVVHGGPDLERLDEVTVAVPVGWV